jgi:hypothetical protein
MELIDLTRDEKVFFAGSLRAMILADGVIEDEEIARVDKIRDEDRFEDMDSCLDEFSKQIEGLGAAIGPGKPAPAYWELATRMTRPEAQELIIRKLEAISLRDGYQKEAEADFFSRLRESWGINR